MRAACMRRAAMAVQFGAACCRSRLWLRPGFALARSTCCGGGGSGCVCTCARACTWVRACACDFEGWEGLLLVTVGLVACAVRPLLRLSCDDMVQHTSRARRALAACVS